jgi:dipeptidyl aminopeptidase/acylaminoacyl peptidase
VDEGLLPRRELFPDFAGARYRFSVTLSPDGERLCWIVRGPDGISLWTSAADGSGEREQSATRGPGEILSCRWAYTSRHLLYQRPAAGGTGSRVYCLDVTTGQIRNLTPDEAGTASINGLSPRFPDEALLTVEHRAPAGVEVRRVHLTTGRPTHTLRYPGYRSVFSDDRFRLRLAMKTVAGGAKESYAAGEDGSWRRLFRLKREMAPLTRRADPLGFDGSGTRVYLLDNRRADTVAVTACDLRTGKTKTIGSSRRADVAAVLLHPRRRTVQAFSYRYDRVRWKVVDPEVEADLARLQRAVDGELSLPSRSLDDRRWIAAYAMLDGSTHYYLYDRDRLATRFLFASHEIFKGLPLAPMRTIILSARDGLPLTGYLTLPPDAAANDGNTSRRPLPMILLVHGGPYGRDEWGFHGEHQWLANRGYAVLGVNYRGSTSFGRKFIEAADHEWGGKLLDDLLAAAGWAVGQKIADPRRIAVMGSSFGGYLTLLALARYPQRFACGIDRAGPANLARFASELSAAGPDAARYVRRRIADPQSPRGKRLLEEWSPVNAVHRIQRPLLIAQGGQETSVQREEKQWIAQELLDRKRVATYVEFPAEGHTFFRRETRLAYYAIIEAFLARHLGGRSEPFQDDVSHRVIGTTLGHQKIPGLADALCR